MSIENIAGTESLNTVTPLSRYLAMSLFVALPFIGGFVGYTLAPQDTHEINENVVSRITDSVSTTSDSDIDLENHDNQLLNSEAPALQFIRAETKIECSKENYFNESIKVGDKAAGMTVVSVMPLRENEEMSSENMEVVFEGDMELIGIPLFNEIGDDLFIVDEQSARKLPCYSNTSTRYETGDLQLLGVFGFEEYPWYRLSTGEQITKADPFRFVVKQYVARMVRSRYSDDLVNVGYSVSPKNIVEPIKLDIEI